MVGAQRSHECMYEALVNKVQHFDFVLDSCMFCFAKRVLRNRKIEVKGQEFVNDFANLEWKYGP